MGFGLRFSVQGLGIRGGFWASGPRALGFGPAGSFR